MDEEALVRTQVLSYPYIPLPADPVWALLWREAERQLDEQLRNWQPLGILTALDSPESAERVARWERNKRGREWWYTQRAELARRAPAQNRTPR